MYTVLTAEQLGAMLGCTGPAIRWYLALLSIVGGRSSWYVPGGVEEIGRIAGISPASSWRAVRELRTADLVRSEHRFTSGAGGTEPGWDLAQSWSVVAHPRPPEISSPPVQIQGDARPVTPDRARPVTPDRARPVTPDRASRIGEGRGDETPPSPPKGGDLILIRDVLARLARAEARAKGRPAQAYGLVSVWLAGEVAQRAEAAADEESVHRHEREHTGRAPAWEPEPADETLSIEHLSRLITTACARVGIRARHTAELMEAVCPRAS